MSGSVTPARVAKLVIRARLKILFPFIRKCEFDSHPGHIVGGFKVVEKLPQTP